MADSDIRRIDVLVDPKTRWVYHRNAEGSLHAEGKFRPTQVLSGKKESEVWVTDIGLPPSPLVVFGKEKSG